MKNKNKIVIVLLLIIVLLSGCTKTLTDGKNPVKNDKGQTLTENILCKPKDSDTIKKYEEHKVDISKLPDCKDFKVTSGGYEGLWTSIFVKPLAWLILKIGSFVNNKYAISLIIVSILIRLVAFPITRKTAMQSEVLKKAKPELDRLEAKYKDKTDQESLMKKNQEMMLIYKKYNFNPVTGCLFSIVQLPLFIAFLEAINRVPAIFESKLLFQMGTSPKVALLNGDYLYIILIILVGVTTYFSFKFNTATVGDSKQATTMNRTMVIMITAMSIFMTSALDIYWITTNLFTIVQNLLIKRGSKNAKV